MPDTTRPSVSPAAVPVVDPPPSAAGLEVVTVHRAWNGWESAIVPIDALEQLCWSWPDGAPQPLLHARVRADRLSSGPWSHACAEAPCRCRVDVCVLKAHACPTQYERLARRAGVRPAS